jgi:hypothetical protein
LTVPNSARIFLSVPDNMLITRLMFFDMHYIKPVPVKLA